MTNLVRTYQAEAWATNPIERRLNARLLDHWQRLRGNRRFPKIGAFDFEAVTGFTSHGFVLELRDGDLDPVFGFVGRALVDDCGVDLTGHRVSEVPRHTLLTQVTDHFLQVLAHKAPIAFEAEYIDAGGDDVPFRSVLLPFSSDGERIDGLIGAINRKEKSSRATFSAGPAAAALRVTQAGADRADELLAAERAEPSDAGSDGDADAGAPAAPSLGDPLGEGLLSDLDASLEECQALARELDSAETRSRAALYRTLEAAYGFHFACAANPKAYRKLLAEAGLRPQARAPFTPIVKLVFGVDHDKTRISEYATALAFARRHNQVEITVRNFIESQPGGIKGCVAAERAARRTARGQRADALEDAKSYLRDLPAITTIPDPARDRTDAAEFILVLGRRAKGDGTISVLRVLDEPTAVVDAALKRAAKALATDPKKPRDD